MKLIDTPNLPDPDAFYADLVAAHDGLTAGQVAAFNAQLVLILSNHIGDANLLRQALELARQR